MTIDIKIKRATLEIALRHMLRGAKKSPERTARNLIEIGSSLSKLNLSDEAAEKLCLELSELIKTMDHEKIMHWMIQSFRL
ncbi:hypothetical protein V6615_06075 [Oscillospiraceae bacterium PP1C4]